QCIEDLRKLVRDGASASRSASPDGGSPSNTSAWSTRSYLRMSEGRTCRPPGGTRAMIAKDGAREELTRWRERLVALSHRIHANPEVAFEEEQSARWTAEALSEAGFAVESGICDLPTAFVARTGSGPLHIAICAEYDSLPA